MNPLVQSFVDRFSQSAVTAIQSKPGFGDYVACLNGLWNAQNGTVVEQTSAIISANPDHPMRFAVYRLWIEALADSGEKLSLHALQEHLLMRGEASPEDRITYMALRGIIHMELDRTHAAQLMLRAISNQTNNPYAMELNQAVLTRDIEPVELPALVQMTIPFDDYIVWQSLVRNFVAMNQRHRAEPCFDVVDSIFAGNPMRDICYYHWTSELADWTSALEHATHLASTFTAHPDHSFYAAHASFKLNRFNQTITTLEGAKSIRLETDPDASLLHGQAWKQIGMQKQDSKILEKARKSLARASKLLSREGISPMPAELLIQEINEALNETAETPAESKSLFRPTKAWLVKLSTRRYQELRMSRESAVEHLVRPLGGEAQPGDLCFFAIDETKGKEDGAWKIAAIYTVDSQPVWHPYWRQQSALQLISMPKKLISVDVKIMDAPHGTKGKKPQKKTKLSKDHPFRFGVFQLEEGALDLIQEAIRQHQQGDNRVTTNNENSSHEAV